MVTPSSCLENLWLPLVFIADHAGGGNNLDTSFSNPHDLSVLFLSSRGFGRRCYLAIFRPLPDTSTATYHRRNDISSGVGYRSSKAVEVKYRGQGRVAFQYHFLQLPASSVQASLGSPAQRRFLHALKPQHGLFVRFRSGWLHNYGNNQIGKKGGLGTTPCSPWPTCTN